jgi:hypothetical protein
MTIYISGNLKFNFTEEDILEENWYPASNEERLEFIKGKINQYIIENIDDILDDKNQSEIVYSWSGTCGISVKA